MRAYTKFKEYIWLVNTIWRAKAITLNEINEEWLKTEMSEGIPLSRTTFYRHKCAIEDIFGLCIECDKKNGNKYYIENETVLDEDSIQNWMLSTLSVGNIVVESQSLYNRILLENIPSGGEKLQTIIKSMKENRKIMLTYQRYKAATKTKTPIEPYCLKLTNKRWYMLGRLSNNWLATYSLDRMEEIQMLSEKFKVPDDFSAAEFFSESYGIVVDSKAPVERVVIRAYGYEPYYLRDLPLHHSQRELSSTDDYADFEMRLKITNDFKAAIVSSSEWIEVLEPQSLAEEIVAWHQAAIDRYKKNKK